MCSCILGEGGARERRGNEAMGRERETNEQSGCVGWAGVGASGEAWLAEARPAQLLKAASRAPDQILWEESRSRCLCHLCCPERHATQSQ